jgi:hypothetical protein
MAELISVKRLPSVGKPGNLYYNNQEKSFHLALGDGTLLPVEGMLSPNPRGIVGPQGERGERGATGPQGPASRDGRDGADSTVPGPIGPRGPKGADGLPGPAGKNGADSTVPGPAGKDGQSIVGPAGPQGPRGDCLIPNNSELAAAVIAYRQKHAAIQASLLTEISKAKNLPASTRLHVTNVLNRVKREAGL